MLREANNWCANMCGNGDGRKSSSSYNIQLFSIWHGEGDCDVHMLDQQKINGGSRKICIFFFFKERITCVSYEHIRIDVSRSPSYRLQKKRETRVARATWMTTLNAVYKCHVRYVMWNRLNWQIVVRQHNQNDHRSIMYKICAKKSDFME